MKSRLNLQCRHGILKSVSVSVISLLLGLWLGLGGRSTDFATTTSALAEAIAVPASESMPTFQTVAIQDIAAGQFVTIGLPGNKSQPLPEDTLTEKAPEHEATGVTEWLEYPSDDFVPYRIRMAVRDGIIVDVHGKDTNALLQDLISTKYVVGDADGTDVTRLLCRMIDLEMPKPDGSIAELSVIRPLWWLQGTGAAVGGSIDIGLHEIGLSGEATVLAIGPCDVDSRETRPGMSIVTGKIRHRNATVWDLTFDDRTEETLGVTANHPLYSETRHAWIPAGDLQLDEVVRTLNGHSTLTGRTQCLERETVFDIEVHRSHAYHVSGLGVLAHNASLLTCGGTVNPNTRFLSGVEVKSHGHVISKGTVDLKPTIDRINAGTRFPHANDGSVFGNRQGRLPTQPHGYYQEFVVPTNGVSGPGAQRLVIGKGGEIFYSPDHYTTFLPVQ